MIRVLFKIVFLLTAVAIIAGCVNDPLDPKKEDGSGTVDCVLSFGSKWGADVTVKTRGALGIMRESNVFNLYLLVFDGNQDNSKKVYGHYFSGDNLGETDMANYWTLSNMSSDSDPNPTHGELHIKTAKVSGGTIVAVANMNPNDLDVSAELLSTIKTYGEINALIATQVRSEVAANSGYFMMTAKIEGVDIQGDATAENDISKKTLSLKRLYSKVTFNVRIAPGAPIRSFIPDKWQVVNVPSCCYLLERTGPYDDAASTAGEFFSTEPLGFETETVTTTPNDFYADGVTKVSSHSFSFYMMENRKEPKATPAVEGGWADVAGDPGVDKYKYREWRDKNPDGTYTTDDDSGFTYANQYSTYVILTGKIVMQTSSGGNDNATLDATVQYIVHLGNFGNNDGDFNTLRNHSYVYNIYINGAENIAAEVDWDMNHPGVNPEIEPGATGRVVVAREKFFDSDCHYSTQVISFHYNYMSDDISWYVESPFNPEGVGPEDKPLSEIDYSWVEFRLNDIDESTGLYTDRRVLYKPHDYRWQPGTPTEKKTMYVYELVDFLMDQKGKYHDGATNLFDATPAGEGGPKISVTAFIDEYYYVTNPITKEYDPTLWKLVVNHPMRRMHILASSGRSKDGKSSLVGSSFTIQQRSIQSIYAVHETADLQSAWGMEYTDDAYETGFAKYWKTEAFEDCGNDSSTNGRLNTLKLWGIVNSDGTLNPEEKRWDTYLNLNGTNETAQLWKPGDEGNTYGYDYNYLRYSCLSRNRDNDGDGIIDPEEIRWYMASDLQLIGVFMGAYGIEGDARLYQKNAAEQAESDKDKWRQHIVASNRTPGTTNSNLYARVIWAEEGITGSNLSYKGSTDQTSRFSARCVRNLGYHMEGGVRRDITLAVVDDPTVEPDPYIVMRRRHLDNDGEYSGTYDNNTYYEFDCSRINTASLREPVDHELIGHDEFSKMACLSSGFVTAPMSTAVDITDKTSYTFNGTTYNLTQYKGLNDYLDACFGGMDVDYSVCPKGYRLPNIREMAVIWNILKPLTTGDAAANNNGYLGHGDANTVPNRTHWSKGPEGTNKVPAAWGWGMMDNKIMMAQPYGATGKHRVQKPRCVKDL